MSATQSAHRCRGWSARPCRRQQRWESPRSRQRGRRYPCQSGTLERGDISHGMWRRGQYYIFIEKSELLKIDRYGIGVNIYLFLFCDLSYYDNHNMPTKPPTSIKCMQFNFESSYNKATTKNITSSTTKSKLYWSKFQTYFVISNLTWPFPCKKKDKTTMKRLLVPSFLIHTCLWKSHSNGIIFLSHLTTRGTYTRRHNYSIFPNRPKQNETRSSYGSMFVALLIQWNPRFSSRDLLQKSVLELLSTYFQWCHRTQTEQYY